MAFNPQIDEEDLPQQKPPGPWIDPLGTQQPYQRPEGFLGGLMSFLSMPGMTEALAAMASKAAGSQFPGRAGQLVTQQRERGRAERQRQFQRQMGAQRMRREEEQLAMSRKRLGLEEERHEASMAGLVWVGDDGQTYNTREEVPVGVTANPVPWATAQQANLQEQQAGLQAIQMWDRLNTTNPNYVVPAEMMEQAGLLPSDLNVVNGVVVDPVGSLPAHLKAQYQGEELPPMQMQEYVAWVASLNRGLMYGGGGVKEANFNLVYEKLAEAHPDWEEQRLIDSAINSVWGGYKSDYERDITGKRLDISEKGLKVGAAEASSRIVDLQNRIQNNVRSMDQWTTNLITGKNAYEMEAAASELASDLAELRKELKMGGTATTPPSVTVPEFVGPERPEATASQGIANQPQTMSPQLQPQYDMMVRNGYPEQPGQRVEGEFRQMLAEGAIPAPMIFVTTPDSGGQPIPALDFGPFGYILVIQSGTGPIEYIRAPNGTTPAPTTE